MKLRLLFVIFTKTNPKKPTKEFDIKGVDFKFAEPQTNEVFFNRSLQKKQEIEVW